MSSANALALINLINLLVKGKISKLEMAAKIGCTIGTVTKWMKILRRKKMVFIEDWRQGLVGAPTALWSFGDFDDAPRPKPMTVAMYSERARAKKRNVLGLQGVTR